MPLTTFLFDLDGTLIDSVRLILDSYHYAMWKHGLPPRSDADWLAGIGTPLTTQFAPWAASPVQMADLIATYREYNLAHHDAQVRAYPGVVAMVRTLHRRGARLGLVTSKNHSGAERGLRVIGLADLFPMIIGADDVKHPKPHPEPVLRALSVGGTPASEAVFIGDSVHDMESGRGAGVTTAAVLWGPFDREHLARTAPDHWLERPEDVVALLDAKAPRA